MSARAACVALALSAAACSDPPGDLIGAYGITMQLESNSCGPAALPLPDGYRYTAELRADGQHGYWRVPKAPPLTGTYDAGIFAFGTTESLELGNADAGTLGCTLVRDEELRGQVGLASGSDAGLSDASDAGDGGVDDAPLHATHNISFSANPAGRCAGSRGPLGPFLVLPCSANYQLVGTAHKAF
ncbi:MAG: hypothetical protein JWN04_816 [Myxococcaceae bacterium]|nr:hypothetical protein [Myxococcaceae bacterium]